MSNRDDFSLKTKDKLARRAGFICSNPECKKSTIGAQMGGENVVNIGIAAHITAASPGGPRYDPSMTPEERSSLSNGIWLCSNCSILIDRDKQKYTIELLKEWKKRAEKDAHENLSNSSFFVQDIKADIFDVTLFYEDLSECYKSLSLFQRMPHIVIDLELFPLPSGWETLLKSNSQFLGLEFSITLHKICKEITSLKKLMLAEKNRVKNKYSRYGHIADVESVAYCNHLDSITGSLFELFTQDVLDQLYNKIKNN